MWYVFLNELEFRICNVNFSEGQKSNMLKISK